MNTPEVRALCTREIDRTGYLKDRSGKVVMAMAAMQRYKQIVGNRPQRVMYYGSEYAFYGNIELTPQFKEGITKVVRNLQKDLMR